MYRPFLRERKAKRKLKLSEPGPHFKNVSDRSCRKRPMLHSGGGNVVGGAAAITKQFAKEPLPQEAPRTKRKHGPFNENSVRYKMGKPKARIVEKVI
jgi:hypothetical protein